MTALETQVAKIHIANSRQATAYVFVMAEKIDATDSELYAVCELPLLNPAAAGDCQRITDSIAAALRRGYRSLIGDNTFENTLAHINDELGRLAGLGKTHWMGKLNAVVAVKTGHSLYVAGTGKITGLLMRDGQFASIVESGAPHHPLKTFENFSVGKLKLDDTFILSTTQLFNFLSVDRLNNILRAAPLADAAAEIIEVLQEDAGPDVAFGAVFALQAEPGLEPEGEVDLGQYITPPLVAGATMAGTTVESAIKGEQEARRAALEDGTATTRDKILNLGHHVKKHARRGLDLVRHFGKKIPQTISQTSFADVKAAVGRNTNSLGLMTERFQRAGSKLRPAEFKKFSWQKKFFFVCAVVFLIALVANIFITKHYKAKQAAVANIESQITEMKKLGDDANAAFLYNDLDQARDLTTQLQSKLKQYEGDQANTAALADVRKQASELQDKLDKKVTVDASSVATLSRADHLIVLPTTIATETNRTIVSYNRATGKTQDNVLKSSESIVLGAALSDTLAAIYNGSELFAWNPATGILSSPFSDSVPNRENSAGLKVYSVNSKAYLIDKAGKRIMNYAVTSKGLSKPTVSVQNDELANATDLAIDGNIYVISSGTILKFQSGKLLDFNPEFTGTLSGKARIYAQVGSSNIYVLDPDNKRIIKLTTEGKLVSSFISDKFTNLVDMTVDEKNKLIFVLNDTTLLKFSF